MSTCNLCFEQKYEKFQNFLSKNFSFLVVKFSVYLNRHVFIMTCKNSDYQYTILFHNLVNFYSVNFTYMNGFVFSKHLSVYIYSRFYWPSISDSCNRNMALSQYCCTETKQKLIGISKVDVEYRSEMQFLKILTNCTLFLASLGGSVGCAVRLETRRSRVQPPPRSATFFRGD